MLAWRCEAARFRHRDRALESLLPEAGLVLDACALVDLSVAEALDARRKAGHSPACKAGCAACCRQPIPVTPLESLAIEAWLELHVPAPRRRLLARQLETSAQQPPQLRGCPFLAENVCGIYPLRPLACRRYLVLGRACAPGEDPTSLRPGDLLRPDPAMLTAALMRTLPWYKDWPRYPTPITEDATRSFFRAVTTTLQALPWQKMLEKNPIQRRFKNYTLRYYPACPFWIIFRAASGRAGRTAAFLKPSRHNPFRSPPCTTPLNHAQRTTRLPGPSPLPPCCALPFQPCS